MMTADTLSLIVVLLIFIFILVRYHKDIKRPLLTILLLGVLALSGVTAKVFQHTWLNVLNLFVLLMLSLTAGCLYAKGILGITVKGQNLSANEWQLLHPRLFKFLEGHRQLPYALLYGSLCSFFTRAISLTIMRMYEKTWVSLEANYLMIDDRLARVALSEGTDSLIKSLFLVVLIWSGAAVVVAFVCSLFVRDRTALRKGTIPMLFFVVFIAPIPLTLWQRLCLGVTCALCAYASSKLCLWNVSERLCNLFTLSEQEGVKPEIQN